MAECYENANEPSGSVKGGTLLGKINDCQLLKVDCVALSCATDV